MTRQVLLVCVTVVALSFPARSSVAQMGPITGGVIRNPTVPNPSAANGLQLSEGAILHSGVGVEGGYDSNVFYNDNDRAGATVLRVTPFLDLTNTSRSGEIPTGLYYDLRASLQYREYFSNELDVSRLRAFVPAISGSLEHNSSGTFALALTEIYTRMEDAPYVRSANQGLIIRNNNVAAVQLRWTPGGGRIQGLLRYTNTIDYFETAYLRAANSLSHEMMLDVSWRWLPKTALYFQLRQGYISYLDSTGSGMTTALGDKYSSFPLRAVLGIRGLITEKTSIAAALGYQNAFYSNGATTGGFLGSTTAAVEFVVLPILSTRIALGARHDFQNSVIGNFYYNDGVYAALAEQTTAGIVGQLWGSFDHRRYYGLTPTASPDPRIDNLTQVGVIVDYFLKSWVYAGASYTLAMNRSDYADPNTSLAGVNYTKHTVFARLGITY